VDGLIIIGILAALYYGVIEYYYKPIKYNKIKREIKKTNEN
jgi:hypothetical protein